MRRALQEPSGAAGSYGFPYADCPVHALLHGGRPQRLRARPAGEESKAAQGASPRLDDTKHWGLACVAPGCRDQGLGTFSSWMEQATIEKAVQPARPSPWK